MEYSYANMYISTTGDQLMVFMDIKVLQDSSGYGHCDLPIYYKYAQLITELTFDMLF